MSEKGYEKALGVLPSERQMNWQKYGYYCMLSYGMNTMKGVEWGDGFASPDSFWPEHLDTDEWAKFVKDAGMSAIVFTAKHFDGFCLWQTDLTDYSLKSCMNWKDGQGDIVADLAVSCRKYGLGFGLYVAPWDKHEPSYGTGKAYDDFFCGLLTELLTRYGDIFCVWLDPRAGTGINGVTQDFDIARYVDTIHSLQRDCCVAGLGSDIRWNGDGRYTPRKNEWSVIPARFYTGKGKKMNFADPDLGSRKTIKNDTEFIWYPLEVAVPLRDHWFYNKEDDYSAKTKDKLWRLYLDSVGNNASLMLGICPDKQGKFYSTDTSILMSFSRDLQLHFGYNLLTEKGELTASSVLSEVYTPKNAVNAENDRFWMPDPKEKKPELRLSLSEEDLFDKLTLCEHIAGGQRVEGFEVQVLDNKGRWKTIYTGSTIGAKTICVLRTMKAKEIRVVFSSYRDTPQISYVSLN